MLSDLSKQALQIDSHLRPSKTKVLHNGYDLIRRGRPPAHVHENGMAIEVMLPYRITIHLSKLIQCLGQHKAEVDNRIAAAWKKFHMLKHE